MLGRLMRSIASYQTPYRGPWTLPKKRGPPSGSLHFRCQTMGLLCTSRVSTMPWPCDMAGPHLNYHTNANVGMECQWSTRVKGGFPIIRHNEIRDLTATLLTEVCSEVSIEPELQPCSDATTAD